MRYRISVTIFLFFLLNIQAGILNAQMPDWKYFRDRDGNGYYYDRALKIRITDDKPFEFIPVSFQNIDYSLHKGIELVKNGKTAEGLFYLKSLKTLPVSNPGFKKNAKDASDWINFLRKRHGVRFEVYDKDSTILLNLADDKFSIINEKLRYKIVLNKAPHIVKAAWKMYDKGYGLKFGFNLDKDNKNEGYDCITGIETRIFKGKIESLKEAESSWRYELGADNFKREEVLRKDDRVIYLYTYNDGVPFTGIEGIFINGNIIHIVRVLCSSSIKDKVFEEIRKPVEEMTLVSVN